MASTTSSTAPIHLSPPGSDPSRARRAAAGAGMAAYAAPSLFQPHHAREAVRDAAAGRIAPLAAYYAALPSVAVTRMVAPMGWDCVWIDWEHSAMGVETMTTMVHESIFMSQGKTIPFVRVPGHDHASIGYALDAGASLIIPQVETVSQARHVISSAKFGASRRGPAGTRSAPPFRLVPGLTDSAAFTPSAMHPDVHACLNDQAAIMLQVETRAGIGQLDAVLAAVGSDVDLVWLGTLDARVSMGLPGHGGLGGAEPAWREAVDLFDATCRKYGVPRGGFAFGQGGPLRGRELVRHCEEKSLAFVVVTGDVMALAGMNGELAAAREAWAAKGQGGEGEEEDKKQVE